MQVNEYFSLDDTISFTVYPSAILGTGFTRVKVLDVLSAETVRLLGFDAQAMHANVKPTLPPGAPEKYNDYKYLKLKYSNGAIGFVGLPWINMSTVVVSAHTTARLTVALNTPADADKIVDMLRANNFNEITLEML